MIHSTEPYMHGRPECVVNHRVVTGGMTLAIEGDSPLDMPCLCTGEKGGCRRR